MAKEKKPAHRPLKYGEPTELVPFRLPISKKAEIKEKFAAILKKYETKKPK